MVRGQTGNWLRPEKGKKRKEKKKGKLQRGVHGAAGIRSVWGGETAASPPRPRNASNGKGAAPPGADADRGGLPRLERCVTQGEQAPGPEKRFSAVLGKKMKARALLLVFCARLCPLHASRRGTKGGSGSAGMANPRVSLLVAAGLGEATPRKHRLAGPEFPWTAAPRRWGKTVRTGV